METINPLWKPPWTTIDPDRYSPGRQTRTYGPPPDGKLLAGIAGHSLSFDHFGPPSKEEAAAGLATQWGGAVHKMEDEESFRLAPSRSALRLRASRGADQV